MRNWIMIFAALMIIAIGLYGSIVLVLNEDRLKGLLALHVERDTGRRIDIRGDLRVRLFPGLRLEAERIEISGPAEYSGPSLLKAEFLEMNLRLVPMIRGELQASQVRLRGASINLHSDADGMSSLQGLLVSEEDSDSAPSWLDGPVQVDDVLINLSDGIDFHQEQFSVDQIELEGFATGEALQFRFIGNVGDPALFDWLEINALMIPQAEDDFRLTNMQMTGSMEDGHFAIELLGNLDVRPGPPLMVALDSGRLRINDHHFQAQLSYSAFDRPYVNMGLSSDLIDLDVAALPTLLAEHLGADSSSRVVSGLQAMDFDLDLVIDQVAQAGLILNDVELQAQSRQRRLSVDRLVAEVPGGHLSALGVLDMARAGWSSEVGLRIDADDFSLLGRAIPWAWMPGGAGAFSLALVLGPGEAGMSIDGEGAVEIWNGQWPVLQGLVPEVWPSIGSEPFEYLSSPIQVRSDQIELTGLQVVNEQLVAQGRLALDWPLGPVEGVLDMTFEDDYLNVLVGGSLSEPLIEWTRPHPQLQAGADP